jgi:hypothetical protein
MKISMMNKQQQQQQQPANNSAGNMSQQFSANHLISDAEFIEIERVMQRASHIEQKESDRIK